jgi:hypothetical protein
MDFIGPARCRNSAQGPQETDKPQVRKEKAERATLAAGWAWALGLWKAVGHVSCFTSLGGDHAPGQ